MNDAPVVTLGETMGLLRSPAIGSLEHAQRLDVHVGGAESNVAIGAVRLGRPAVWMGRVGDDGMGRRVLRELRAEGVEVRAAVDPALRTGIMLKESPTAGTTRVVYYRAGSAGSALSPADIDETAIADAGILHVTGITPALSDSASAAVDAAIDIATAARVPVSFDVNHRASLWGGRDAGAAYRRIAERADLVFAGADEAALLVGDGSPHALARRIAGLGATQAIIKLGAAGCTAFVDGRAYTLPARPVEVVDTVGAGDAFVAGYLVALLEGADPRERVQQATSCGAFACLGPGDWESLPRRSDLVAGPGGDPVIR